MVKEKGDDLKSGDNVRLRSDGRYEARYQTGRDVNGTIIYGCCYGKTYEEAVEKRDYQLMIAAKKKRKKMNLLILGAGAQGLEILDIAKNLRLFSKIDFLDDNPQLTNVIGKWKDVGKFAEEYPIAIIAVADEEIRRVWMERITDMGFIIPTLVHPTAYVPEGTWIGEGSVICARSTIATGVSIGKGCIVTSGSTVPKSTKIPDWGYFDFDKCITGYHEEYVIPEE